MIKHGGDDKDDLFADINITPLTDCMMVLLIIFMITATAITQAGFGIKLPSVKKADSLPKAPVTLSVSYDGSIYLGADRIDRVELKPKLSTLSKKGYRNLVITADRQVSYGSIIRVMEDVRGSGFAYIALAARETND
ncbi:MAG: biopolymer transporter ExbD [Chloroflexi bacterium]|nr:biopolymer transporter ExbD [Chloroflexota bacterium]